LPCSIRIIILVLSMSLGSRARVSPKRRPPLYEVMSSALCFRLWQASKIAATSSGDKISGSARRFR